MHGTRTCLAVSLLTGVSACRPAFPTSEMISTSTTMTTARASWCGHLWPLLPHRLHRPHRCRPHLPLSRAVNPRLVSTRPSHQAPLWRARSVSVWPAPNSRKWYAAGFFTMPSPSVSHSPFSRGVHHQSNVTWSDGILPGPRIRRARERGEQHERVQLPRSGACAPSPSSGVVHSHHPNAPLIARRNAISQETVVEEEEWS